jgi:hypothetical protein
MEPQIDYLELRIETLSIHDFHLKDAYLRVRQMQPLEDFYIKQIRYGKVRIGEIKGKVELKSKVLSVDSFSGNLLQVTLQGDLRVMTEKNPEYNINLKFQNLDLQGLVNNFNLTEKFEMSGNLDGRVSLVGRGLNINWLQGEFLLPKPGGILNIKDNQFLKTIAQNTQQPLDTVATGYKEYHYNTGKGELALQKNNLILNVALDGETGQRNFKITLHDFK